MDDHDLEYKRTRSAEKDNLGLKLLVKYSEHELIFQSRRYSGLRQAIIFVRIGLGHGAIYIKTCIDYLIVGVVNLFSDTLKVDHYSEGYRLPFCAL